MVDIRFRGIGMFIKRRLCLNRFRIIILMLSICTCSVQTSWAETGNAPKNILIYNSYNFGLPIYKTMLQMGMEESLRKGGLKDHHLSVEFIDLGYNSRPDWMVQLNNLIHQRYPQYRIELVIMDFFNEIPVAVLLGPQYPDTFKEEHAIILAAGRMDILGTLNSAIYLMPETRRLLVINGTSGSDRRFELQARKELEAWAGKLEIEFLNNLSMEEMLQKVSDQPPQTVIMYLNISQDVTGKYFLPADVLDRIAKAANVPVFSLLSHHLNSGIIGGSLTNFRDEGNRVGEIVLEILKRNVPVVPLQNQAGMTRLMFNWEQLDRWGLSKRRLPADSIVINRPVSLWARHKTVILTTVGFIIVLCAAVVILYLNILKRWRVEVALRRSEANYRKLYRQWVDIEENERKRLSAELHDEIGQNLTALGINLAIIQMRTLAAIDSDIQDRIDESRRLLSRTTAHVKGIMLNLRPMILDEYGLVPALQWYAQENAKRSGIEISFSADELPYRPVAEIETALFRIASEAINNSLKHAGANSINLTLNCAEDRLRMVIMDDGAGFEMEKLQGQDHHGWGLMIMQERCVGISGLFDIESTPGQGTRISVEVPL